MCKEKLLKEVQGLNEKYEELRGEINKIKANDNLANDSFFDDEDSRKKYSDWIFRNFSRWRM